MAVPQALHNTEAAQHAAKKAPRRGWGAFVCRQEAAAHPHRRHCTDQVFWLMVMVGNLLEKSLALLAIFTATSRASFL